MVSRRTETVISASNGQSHVGVMAALAVGLAEEIETSVLTAPAIERSPTQVGSRISVCSIAPSLVVSASRCIGAATAKSRLSTTET